MRRNAVVTLAVVIAVVALGAYAAIPAYVSSKIEDDLTAGGGRAHVTVKGDGFPSTSLLDREGQSIEVTGSGLELTIPQDKTAALNGLDGFDEVRADLRDVTAGPFKVSRVKIDRENSTGTYRVAVDATATPSELGDYALARWGDGFFGDLMTRIAGDVTTASTDPVTLHIDARLETGGTARVVETSGGLDGLDSNAVAAAVASAALARF